MIHNHPPLESVQSLTLENSVLSDKVNILEERIEQMRAAFIGSDWAPPSCLCLTDMETRILQILYKRTRVTRSQMMTALYVGRETTMPGDQIISVYMTKMRRKMKPYGIAIPNSHGKGYRLEGHARARMDYLIAEQDKGHNKNDPAPAKETIAEGAWSPPLDFTFSRTERNTLTHALAIAVGISVVDLGSTSSRRRTIAKGRHRAAYLLMKELDLSAAAAGRILWRDHTTILYGVKKIEDACEDPLEGKILEGMGRTLQRSLMHKKEIFSPRAQSHFGLLTEDLPTDG